MADPTLAERLRSLEIPTLVLWSCSDGIVDVGARWHVVVGASGRDHRGREAAYLPW